MHQGSTEQECVWPFREFRKDLGRGSAFSVHIKMSRRGKIVGGTQWCHGNQETSDSRGRDECTCWGLNVFSLGGWELRLLEWMVVGSHIREVPAELWGRGADCSEPRNELKVTTWRQWVWALLSTCLAGKGRERVRIPVGGVVSGNDIYV